MNVMNNFRGVWYALSDQTNEISLLRESIIHHQAINGLLVDWYKKIEG